MNTTDWFVFIQPILGNLHSFFKKAIVLTEMVGYNRFIIFQYYYLNIKILKFYDTTFRWPL
jgi:hypothetical protein